MANKVRRRDALNRRSNRLGLSHSHDTFSDLALDVGYVRQKIGSTPVCVEPLLLILTSAQRRALSYRIR